MSKKQMLIGRETIPVKRQIKKAAPVEAKPVYVAPEEDRSPVTRMGWINRQRKVKHGEIPRTNDNDGEPIFFYCQTISFQEYIDQLYANAQRIQ